MRQRINERLTDFYQLLQWFNRLKIDSSLRAILYPPLINESIKKPSDKTDQSDENSKLANDSNKKISAEQKQKRLEWLNNQAALSGNKDLMDDPNND
ncbi:hypothetical protein CAN34_13860, partial [Psychrobacter sp. DAB_AL32B]